MKQLFLDCGMGAAGDMLAASLLELLDKPERFVSDFNGIGLSDVVMQLETKKSCGISGSHVRMLIAGSQERQDDDCLQEHLHGGCGRTSDEVTEIIKGLNVSPWVCQNALAIYELVRCAEAKVHNRQVALIHFHELGNLDAIADIVAVCMLLEKLSPDAISASPINVGSGKVRCTHGILPVPAPATAELLMGIPSYGGSIEGELCTPTGAAILRHFVHSYGTQPLMSVSKIGYGIGTKEFLTVNCIRSLFGETISDGQDEIDEIRCNLDDMTGEAIGFAMEILLESGALDVYTVSIGMKKSRPGVMLSCLSKKSDTQRLAALMLRHTSSLGVRITAARRIVLQRETRLCSTPYGEIRVKLSDGRAKAEFDDLAKIAREQDLSLAQAAQLINPIEGKV